VKVQKVLESVHAFVDQQASARTAHSSAEMNNMPQDAFTKHGYIFQITHRLLSKNMAINFTSYIE
jgi:hypothetical protein